jgi:hypothetical protein
MGMRDRVSITTLITRIPKLSTYNSVEGVENGSIADSTAILNTPSFLANTLVLLNTKL